MLTVYYESLDLVCGGRNYLVDENRTTMYNNDGHPLFYHSLCPNLFNQLKTDIKISLNNRDLDIFSSENLTLSLVDITWYCACHITLGQGLIIN